jgi:radical SAM superfamily enzyme YgiQ (UPF0313 family)
MRVSLLNPYSSSGTLLTDSVLARECGIVSKGDFPHPPIGLAYIATVIRNSGWEVQIIDGNVQCKTKKEFFEKIDDFQPDLIFLQVPTPGYGTCVNLTKDFHNSFKAKIIWLGPHVTALPERALEDGADLVIRGEPELTVRELIENKFKPSKKIKGISFKENGVVINTPNREPIENLDELSFPSRDLLDLDKYILPYGTREAKYTPIISARGCPFRCFFCTSQIFYNHFLRMRSTENIMKEVEEVVNKYGIKHLSFWDDTFTANKKRVIEICDEIIKRKLDITWFCFGRVDTVDKEVLAKMKAAGCYQIQFGAESGDPEILKKINKGITVEQIRNAVKLTQEAGIEAAAFFIFGFPWETKETITRTIEFIKEIKPDYVNCSVATPYPGTEYFNMVFGNARIDDWSEFDTYHIVSCPPALEPEDITKTFKQVYRQFYFNPALILREMKKIRNFGMFKKKVSTFFTLIRMYGK